MTKLNCLIQTVFSSCSWSGVADTPREIAEPSVTSVSSNATTDARRAMDRIRLRCSAVRSGRNTMTRAATVVTKTTELSSTEGRSRPGLVAGVGVAGVVTGAGTGATVAANTG